MSPVISVDPGPNKITIVEVDIQEHVDRSTISNENNNEHAKVEVAISPLFVSLSKCATNDNPSFAKRTYVSTGTGGGVSSDKTVKSFLPVYIILYSFADAPDSVAVSCTTPRAAVLTEDIEYVYEVIVFNCERTIVLAGTNANC